MNSTTNLIRLILFIAIILPTGINAQDIGIGIKGGMNFATINSSTNFDNRTGYQAGVYLRFGKSSRLAIQPEILYNTKGASFQDEEIKIDYLSVPVLVKFGVIGPLYIEAGPQISFLTNSVREVDTGDKQALEDFMKSSEWAIVAGVGAEVGRFQLSARYDWGISEIDDGFQFEDLYADNSFKNSTFTLSVGFQLNKRPR
ncbi:porin family protein [Marinigracilibium pacificum]|uniref:PorT family protein n=1 Tax=Marinigracilibium pacificum TaxID=2729599 RepID=A0A848IV37_9BACT|nr:porin family protein [Marinigracilibium pacificum]NMM48197.1 PorT family protein [Marinigracilibium pacificum]